MYRHDPGPHTWEVCEACDYARHRCRFCGDDLTHAEDRYPSNHACYRRLPT